MIFNKSTGKPLHEVLLKKHVHLLPVTKEVISLNKRAECLNDEIKVQPTSVLEFKASQMSKGSEMACDSKFYTSSKLDATQKIRRNFEFCGCGEIRVRFSEPELENKCWLTKSSTSKRPSLIPLNTQNFDKSHVEIDKIENLDHGQFKNNFENCNFSLPCSALRRKIDCKLEQNQRENSTFLRKIVLPKWIKYLDKKTRAKEVNATVRARNDTLWKKLIRDVREFYRIFHKELSVCRRHDCVPNSDSIDENCVQVMFKYLGIQISKDEATDGALYEFLHQTHKRTIASLFNHQTKKLSPFSVLDRYNESKLTKFMKHPTASEMFCLVFSNFLEEYVLTISKNYQRRLTSLLCCVLRCYQKMKNLEDLTRIEYWTK